MTRPPKLTAVTSTNAALVATEQRDANAHRAYEMRCAGKSWYTIAQALGITERNARQTVASAMTEAAAMVSDESKWQLLALECDRLDTMQAGIWASAISGNFKAIEAMLKIITVRARLLGLENIPDQSITNNTLVVAGSQEEYVAALRAIAAGHQG